MLNFYKFSFLTLIAFSFFSNFIQKTFADETFFIVTAYYSPLPNQKSYITGSYYGDIKLNGGGKITASGKPVHTGLLAAPKNYAFGTKIELEGLGVGEVNDRGGAIVKASSSAKYDRLDAWMGYGDEGLQKAISWGKRTVAGKILDNKENISINQDGEDNLSDIYVTPDSNYENIKLLQNIFKQNGLYDGEINGDYNSIKWYIIDFQKEIGIIKNNSDWGAGYFGKQTKQAFLNKYGANSLVFKKETKAVARVLKDKEIENKEDIIISDIILTKKIEKYIEKESKGDKNKKQEIIENIKARLESMNNKQLKNKIAYLSESI